MFRPILAFLLAGLPAAHAQEPLFLRIRPPDGAPRDAGAAGAADEAARQAAANRARAARESVWARSDRRARIAIASICTGCLAPERPTPTIPVLDRPETVTTPEPDPGPTAAPSDPSFAQTGTP